MKKFESEALSVNTSQVYGSSTLQRKITNSRYEDSLEEDELIDHH